MMSPGATAELTGTLLTRGKTRLDEFIVALCYGRVGTVKKEKTQTEGGNWWVEKDCKGSFGHQIGTTTRPEPETNLTEGVVETAELDFGGQSRSSWGWLAHNRRNTKNLGRLQAGTGK